MPTAKLSKSQIARKHVHNRILFQFVVFIALSAVLTTIVTVDMLHEQMNVLWVIGSLIVGVLTGVAAGRIFAVKWHEDTQKVILSLDKLSFLLIIAYVAFRYVSDQFLAHILHGQELTIITFTLLAGIMIGRFVGMGNSVVKVLKQQNIL